MSAKYNKENMLGNSLEQSSAGHGFARNLHSDRGGKRPDHADRRMGAPGGLPGGGLVARTAPDRSQYLANPVSPWRSRRVGTFRAAPNRACTRPSATRKSRACPWL